MAGLLARGGASSDAIATPRAPTPSCQPHLLGRPLHGGCPGRHFVDTGTRKNIHSSPVVAAIAGKEIAKLERLTLAGPFRIRPSTAGPAGAREEGGPGGWVFCRCLRKPGTWGHGMQSCMDYGRSGMSYGEVVAHVLAPRGHL